MSTELEQLRVEVERLRAELHACNSREATQSQRAYVAEKSLAIANVLLVDAIPANVSEATWLIRRDGHFAACGFNPVKAAQPATWCTKCNSAKPCPGCTAPATENALLKRVDEIRVKLATDGDWPEALRRLDGVIATQTTATAPAGCEEENGSPCDVCGKACAWGSRHPTCKPTSATAECNYVGRCNSSRCPAHGQPATAPVDYLALCAREGVNCACVGQCKFKPALTRTKAEQSVLDAMESIPEQDLRDALDMPPPSQRQAVYRAVMDLCRAELTRRGLK